MIILLILAISSVGLSIIKSADAQTATPTPTIPMPSVPQFTIKYVNSSYEVPASSTINQFTGQEVTSPSYHVENSSIVITILNQPFTPYIIDNYGNRVNLLYNVRMKGQFTDVWTNLYNNLEDHPLSSGSEYTVLTFPVNSNASNSLTIPIGSQVDFQVQAMIGYGQVFEGFGTPLIFHGNTSGWSDTQTVTIPASSTSASPSPTPTSTPAVPELSWLVIVPLFLSMLSVAVIIRHRKNH